LVKDNDNNKRIDIMKQTTVIQKSVSKQRVGFDYVQSATSFGLLEKIESNHVLTGFFMFAATKMRAFRVCQTLSLLLLIFRYYG